MTFSKVFYLMAIFFPLTSIFAENKNPKVVVVGAGIAGLTTAYRLKQQGVDVHLYEARNRVGGRILTATVKGKIAELGAQNITDGGEAENLHRLIDEFGLELTEDRVKLNHFYFDGQKLISAQQLFRQKHFDPESLKIQLDDLVERSSNMHEVLKGILPEEELLFKILSGRLAAYEGAPIEKLSARYAETLYYMLLGGLAAVHQGEGTEKELKLLCIKEGTDLLPKKMAEALEGRIHLNQPLLKVSRNADRSYILTFQDDQKINADILVLAIPCTTYQEIVFEEGVIPLERLAAIQNVQYGTNAKIIVPFVDPPFQRIGLMNDRALSFFTDGNSLLTIYYIGLASRFSQETILQTYQQERPMMELGFGENCPAFSPPVFAKDEASCAYEGPTGYSWPNDPYVKGSYSYIAPGQEAILTATREECGEIVKTLFAPIDQKLYFAGEHASILMEVPGTMEAACESGERVARMVLKHPLSR